MSLPALVATAAELRRLGVTGLAASAATRSKLSTALSGARTRSAIVCQLSERLSALSAAPEEQAGGRLISAFSLSRALRSTQTAAAPEGALRPAPGRIPGETSGRHSSRLLATLRADLSTGGPGRLERLRQAPGALLDLRMIHLLPGALDHPPIAGFIEELLLERLGADASTIDAVEASLSGLPAADARRLLLISHADKARGQALARRLLEDKPKPVLKAQIYLSLANDPDALDLLRAGAKKGAREAKKAAYSALAERREPEAIAAIAGQLGVPDKRRELHEKPVSFTLLEGAFCKITDAGLRQTMQDALLDKQLPIEDAGERWSRVDWAEALAACPPDAASVAALTTACEAGWAPNSAVNVVALEAPLERLRQLLLPKARAAMERTGGLLLAGAARLPLNEFYELLSPSFLEDKELQAEMIYWRKRQYSHEDWTSILGAVAELRVRWDARWLKGAVEHELFDVAAALAGREDGWVGPILLSQLAELAPRDTSAHLRALARSGHPAAGEAIISTFKRAAESRLQAPELNLLSLLSPAETEALSALCKTNPGAYSFVEYFLNASEGDLS